MRLTALLVIRSSVWLDLAFASLINPQPLSVMVGGIEDKVISHLIPGNRAHNSLAPVTSRTSSRNCADEKKSAALHHPAWAVNRATVLVSD